MGDPLCRIPVATPFLVIPGPRAARNPESVICDAETDPGFRLDGTAPAPE
jgi:hypothetical protein